MKNLKPLRKWTSMPAIVLLILPISEPISATTASENFQPGQTQQVTSLRIEVLQGEEGVNIIKQKTAVQPVVQVRDQNNLPVAGATVIFLLPTSGASGTFVGGGNVATVVTDAAGRASAALNPNNVAGPLKITVNASFQGQTATTTIAQTNVVSAGQNAVKAAAHSHALTIGIAAGLAAVAGIVLGVHASSGSNGIHASISTGTGAVGPPR